MNKKYIPYSEKADKWIKKNENKIQSKVSGSCYNAETIFISKNGDGFLIKEEIFELFVLEKTEEFSGLRMLFKAMSENRLFTWDKNPMYPTTTDKLHTYRIAEYENGFLRKYEVPALFNLDNLIRSYLLGDICVDIDFDKLEMRTLSDSEDINQ